ncbi:GGDEF domain-containing phosphodiesterase [uncultured Campylobacter sp.]|uniref:EAL domain-containing protein n=1 Tax=uncultured Campylobacter sp. TaxID=218934 RepID=UPI003211BA35
MQNLDFKKSMTQFIVLPIAVLVICSCLAMGFIFYKKLQDSSNYISNIDIQSKVESYMNILQMIYKDVAKRDVEEFQRYSELANSIPSWMVKQTGEKNELIILASSQQPSLIGENLPYKFCGMDANAHAELARNGAYKSIKLIPDNKAEICYFKNIDGAIIGYNMVQGVKISGFDDPLFAQWFIVNMKNTFIVTSVMVVICIFQYLLFYRSIRNNQVSLMKTNAKLVANNAEMQKRLYRDSLTGLPNKTALERDLETMKSPKIIIVDIDEFRKMNNYFGTAVCDRILVRMTQISQKFADDNNMAVYRVGPDQFAFIEDAAFFIDRYEDLATELLDNIKGLVVDITALDGEQSEIEIHCTVGFALDETDTFKKAMVALEFAKQSGKDYFCYFKNIDDTPQYAEQITRSNMIRNAIINDRIVPFYQPIFNKEKQIVKHETLIRIQNSNEIISPSVFLEVSKRIKRYTDIEKMLIEKSFKLIADRPDAVISINLSGRDMTDGDVSVFIIEKLNKYKVAGRVIFEILEDENIENIERIGTFIERVRRMGVKIAIDDFGSGYSNFSYILKLKPDYIKIDGSIIKNIDTSEDSRAIAGAIIAFAKKLDITVIAEFVRSKEVFDACVELGVDEFQGFYLGEPRDSLYED